jgi:hypothetical protein
LAQLEVATGVLEDREKEIAVLKDNVKEAKEGRSKWRLWCLITWGVIALYVVLKLRAKLPF